MEKLSKKPDRGRQLLIAAISGNLVLNGVAVTDSFAAAPPHIRHPAPSVAPEATAPRLAVRTARVSDVPSKVAQHKRHLNVLLSNQAVTVVGHTHEHSTYSYTAARGQWLKTLRVCESGDNYHDDTGNGYYGAYQFSPETWDNLHTGYALPTDAPPAVQDRAIIENTERSSGGLATQNPGCYEKEHLSQFPPQ